MLKLSQTCCVFFLLVVASVVHADEKRHQQLADEYIDLSGFKKQLESLNEQSAELYAKTNPELKNRQAAIQRAYDKVYSFAKIKPELTRLFMQYFTEMELLELVSFLKTPTGKKFAEKTPEIAKAYVESFRKLAGEEGENLSKAIQEELQKNK